MTLNLSRGEKGKKSATNRETWRDIEERERMEEIHRDSVKERDEIFESIGNRRTASVLLKFETIVKKMLLSNFA